MWHKWVSIVLILFHINFLIMVSDFYFRNSWRILFTYPNIQPYTFESWSWKNFRRLLVYFDHAGLFYSRAHLINLNRRRLMYKCAILSSRRKVFFFLAIKMVGHSWARISIGVFLLAFDNLHHSHPSGTGGIESWTWVRFAPELHSTRFLKVVYFM